MRAIRDTGYGSEQKMQGATLDRVKATFGDEAGDQGWREASYELLESFVTAAAAPGGGVNTSAAVAALQAHLRGMSDKHFAFLLTHSGYIPDHYSPDSSEETLHTKLTEVVACEWGRRVGLESTLQTEKSSKEDVTFKLGTKVVVSDTKSYRLGRSQAAPNVKDAIKEGDYAKWLGAYNATDRLGGLVTFPSRHDWKRSSDVYAYVSNPNNAILFLFYEHLAYMVLDTQQAKTSRNIIGILEDYPNLFNGAQSKERDPYWATIVPRVNALRSPGSLPAFLTTATAVVDEAVEWAVKRLERRIQRIHDTIASEINALPVDVLRERLIAEKSVAQTADLVRYIENITSYR